MKLATGIEMPYLTAYSARDAWESRTIRVRLNLKFIDYRIEPYTDVANIHTFQKVATTNFSQKMWVLNFN